MAEDKIILQGMVFYGYHGVNPEERRLGQRFVVDLELAMDLAPAGRTDDLTATVNYASAFKLVRSIVEGEPCDLIETVAERIGSKLLESFPLESVRVRVGKPWAPVKGSVMGTVAVEILRHGKSAH